METSVHLISMPLCNPLHPSSQLGCLQAYLEREFVDRVPVQSHSAHLDILFDVEDASMMDFYSLYRLFGEELFFLVCCYRHPDVIGGFDRLLKRYNEHHRSELKITRKLVVALASSMESYLKRKFIPSLRSTGINVIGLTTTFAQLFASIFAARYVRRHSDRNVLFVFGGASMSLPEANRTLALWGINGLTVKGSGEVPLCEIVHACLGLGDEHSKTAAESIGASQLRNVVGIGSAPRPIDLEMSKGFLGAIPDPDYDEFFSRLRSLCADSEIFEAICEKFVVIPLEGSRGCFAKCDFCQNPNITSQFRTLKGRAVADRALRVTKKHRRPHVFFADSVCNSWAEEYADDLLSRGTQLRGFMEMRVHAPERFWTKLALCGVTEIQLGIEAISEPLLRGMNKGTTVVQNLSASKYLAELGISSGSNLITHHPKSSVADVEETARLAVLMEHMPEFYLSRFVISYDSPIFRRLDRSQRKRLVGGFNWLPTELVEFSFLRDLAYAYPEDWLDPHLVVAWNEFQAWYEARRCTPSKERPIFNVDSDSNGKLHVLDTRYNQRHEYFLTGLEAVIFDLCHQPLSLAQIAERAGVADMQAGRILDDFVKRHMIVAQGGRFLNIALRQREVLIRNLRVALLSERSIERTSGSEYAVPVGS